MAINITSKAIGHAILCIGAGSLGMQWSPFQPFEAMASTVGGACSTRGHKRSPLEGTAHRTSAVTCTHLQWPANGHSQRRSPPPSWCHLHLVVQWGRVAAMWPSSGPSLQHTHATVGGATLWGLLATNGHNATMAALGHTQGHTPLLVGMHHVVACPPQGLLASHQHSVGGSRMASPPTHHSHGAG